MLDAAFLLDICWVSWIFGFIAFFFWKILSTIYSDFFFPIVSFSLFLPLQFHIPVDCYMFFHSSVILCPFLKLLYLCASFWLISIAMSLNSFIFSYIIYGLLLFLPGLGLLKWLSGKESTCQCKRCRKLKFDPWVGKISWSRKWQPSPIFLPGKNP